MSKRRETLPPALISRYRSLLVTEPSPQGLRDALDLVQDVAGLSLKPHHSGNGRTALDPDEFITGTLELAEPGLSDFLAERRGQKLEPEEKVMLYRVAATLALGRLYRALSLKLSGASESLFLDTILIVFHQAYFLFLAEPDRLPKAVREKLLGAMLRYAEQLPSPADSFRLLALVNEALGYDDLADTFCRRSLLATPAEAHEYLTALQSAWGRYLDTGRYAQAMLLLCEELPRVTRANFAEFRELVEMTLEMWHKQSLAAGSHA